jgi:hypothetical protein
MKRGPAVRSNVNSHLPISRSLADWYSFCLHQYEGSSLVPVHIQDHNNELEYEARRCDYFEKNDEQHAMRIITTIFKISIC